MRIRDTFGNLVDVPMFNVNGPMSIKDLARILSMIEQHGGVIVTGVVEGGLTALEIGALLGSVGLGEKVVAKG